MKLPSIKLTNALDMPSIPLKQPSAEMPIFPPVVIPPNTLQSPKGVEMEEVPAETEDEEIAKTEQPSYTLPVVKIDLPLPNAEIIATATYAAVTAVAATTLATPLFDKLKKQIQKFLQKKVDKWKETQQKKREARNQTSLPD
jgi:hypothetical protein